MIGVLKCRVFSSVTFLPLLRTLESAEINSKNGLLGNQVKEMYVIFKKLFRPISKLTISWTITELSPKNYPLIWIQSNLKIDSEAKKCLVVRENRFHTRSFLRRFQIYTIAKLYAYLLYHF